MSTAENIISKLDNFSERKERRRKLAPLAVLYVVAYLGAANCPPGVDGRKGSSRPSLEPKSAAAGPVYEMVYKLPAQDKVKLRD